MTGTFCAAAGRRARGGVGLAGLKDNSGLRPLGESRPVFLCIDGIFRAGDKPAK